MRLRDLVGILLGVVAVAGLAYGGWWYLSDTLAAAEDPAADVDALIASYLAAWEDGDHAALVDLVRDPPEDLVARHDQLRGGLEVTTLSIASGAVDDSLDGQAIVPLTITVSTPLVADPVRWDTRLVALRQQGTWGVEWSLSTLHPELRPTWSFGWTSEPVQREPILARDGSQLAGPGRQVVLGFQPAIVSDPDAVISAFARALPGTEAIAARELGRSDLNPDWFYPIVTVTQTQADRARPTLRQTAGIIERPRDADRVLLDDGFAYHVVGIVAEATAEQLEDADGALEAGDRIGQFGLEQVLEPSLVGSDRVLVGLRDGVDGPLQVVLAEGQEDGSTPAVTTIDVAVQRAVENALHGVDAPAGIVVVDTATGAIRGAASRPLTGFNRAFAGRYPPGSTFKIVTAEALLATGVVPEDEVSCPPDTVVGGLAVPNAGARALGTTTLGAAFAASCNTTFAALGAGLGAEAMQAAANRFGFDVAPRLPLDAFGGSFPAPVDTAEVAAASFGQGRVEASPLHMASVAAAAATGTWRAPFLLEADGPAEQRALGTGVRDPLRAMLLQAVTDGTGAAAAVPGEQVLGKTGTAQGSGGVEHAWFVGIWGDLAFAVLVEGGGVGSEVAAPIAARLVRELVVLTSGEVDPSVPGAGAGTAAEPADATDQPADDGAPPTPPDADAVPDDGDAGTEPAPEG